MSRRTGATLGVARPRAQTLALVCALHVARCSLHVRAHRRPFVGPAGCPRIGPPRCHVRAARRAHFPPGGWPRLSPASWPASWPVAGARHASSAGRLTACRVRSSRQAAARGAAYFGHHAPRRTSRRDCTAGPSGCAERVRHRHRLRPRIRQRGATRQADGSRQPPLALPRGQRRRRRPRRANGLADRRHACAVTGE